MPHPRYRVRTLLITTTIAAVVLACLAPWLRDMTQAQAIGVVGRVVFLGIGVLLGMLIPWWNYRRVRRKEHAAELGIEAMCTKVRPEWLLRWSAALGLTMAIFIDFWGTVLFPVNNPLSPFEMAWVWWLTGGGMSARCAIAWSGRATPVYLTPVWLISPWVSSKWYVGIEYHWQDRLAGRLILIVPESYHLELSIPPENIEEVDRILSHMLDPPKYCPPVVPSPPAT